MKMIKAIVRPEKSADILLNLSNNGFPAATRANVLGRGNQQGLKIDTIHYDELAKDSITIVVEDQDSQKVIDLIMESAKVKKTGSYGDGKIFVTPVDAVYTISSGKPEL
ncbi:MAG: P-II family nitrogen regulator [Lachnospiraceae bacterium]|nr:P-II family nitrogen regulator [Lachnospiraceae bacterium]